jgi:CubicO group peptidase (beta-lactamase class C family)
LQPNGIDGDNQFGGYDDINEAIRKLDLVENQSTPTNPPGTIHDYSNPGAQAATAAVLSELLKQEDPRQTLLAYVQERIFDKLGMTETDLDIFQPGEPCLYGGIQSTALDFARVGLMILNGGKWDGSQCISEDAMKIMLGCPDVVKNLSQTDQAHLWWLPKDLTSAPRYYAALGFRDSNMHVFPDHGLIFVRLQSFNFPNEYFQRNQIGYRFTTFPAELVKRHLGAHPSQGETNLSDLASPPAVE